MGNNKMNNPEINSMEVVSLLENHDFKASVVSIHRLPELKDQVDRLYRQRLFNETFYQERLKIFDFSISKVFPNDQSIIIATIKQPIVQVEFLYRGKIHSIIVPPTYDDKTDRQALNILEARLAPEGFAVKEANLPEKLLLVMSGLGKYGRNNIAYVEGMGSFHRPVTFVTDAKLEEMNWGSPTEHEKCLKCKACLKNCPTGAITDDQFLLKAEKCLTFHNESGRQFPEWIKSEWHHCLIGCMVCQNICPLNKECLENIENAVAFSEQETMEILSNTAREKLSPGTVEKLRQINLFVDYNLLSRNLGVLVRSPN
jgi:epoxyqueuosine reductase